MVPRNTADLTFYVLTQEHAEHVFAPLCDNDLYTFIPDTVPDSVEKLQERYTFLQAGSKNLGEVWYNWILFSEVHDAYVGLFQSTVRVGGETEISYFVFKKFWGNQYGTKAGRQVVKFLFEKYQINSIFAYIDSRNTYSQRVVENLGFIQTREIKNADHFKGCVSHEYVYEKRRK